jgi:hypothetical protein
VTDDDRQVLEFAKLTWRNVGLRENALREQLDMSPARFSQRLDRIIDMPEAYVAEPMLVKRLLRLRAQRIGQRAG